MRRRLLLPLGPLLPLVPLLLSPACSGGLDGPAPVVQGLSPSLVCGEQLDTTVTLSGESLSPLGIEAATGDPLLAVPDIRLRRIQDAAGAPATGPDLLLPNDPADPAASRVVWTSTTTMTFVVYPELGVEPGLYEVTVTNRNGKTATLTAALAAVPRPTLVSAEPDLLCVAEGGRPVTLRGSDFLAVGDLLPTVAFGDGLSLPVETVEDCADVAGPTAARVCATAHVTIPADALAAGAYAVTVTNPDPAGCHSTDAVTIAVVPPPTLDTIEPDLVCLAEGARALVAAGADFLVVDGVYPTVYLSDGTEEVAVVATAATGCAAVEGTLLDAQACTGLELSLGIDELAPGAWAARVENPAPAGCSSDEVVSIAVVPPPAIEAVVPDLVCLSEAERAFSIEGSGFVVLDATTFPAVTIGGVDATVVAATGCAAIDGTLLAAQACDTLAVTVPADALAPGAHEVVVENPAPAGCSSTEAITVAVVPPPEVLGVTPDLLCTAAGASLTVTGAGFVAVGTSLPTVHLGDAALVADSVGGCAAIDGALPSEDARSCTSLAVTVPADALAAGALPLVVENPAPAGCSSTEAITVAAVGPPTIAALEPAAICLTAPIAEITATGVGFLVLRGAPDTLPIVLLDGSARPVTAVGGCAPVAGTALDADACTSITFSVPTLDVGRHGVAIVNPAPAGCATAAEFPLDVAPAPVLDSVEPLMVCASGGSFVVNAVDAAHGFATGAQVLVRPNGGGAFTPVASTYLGATQVEGTVGSMAPGFYDVTVENGTGCEATPLPAALDLVAAPFVYFADPPVVYDGIDLTVTVYASGVTGTVQTVSARSADGMSAPVPLTIVDATRPGRVQVLVPSGLLPAGDYDILLADDLCASVLPAGLHVTSELTVWVEDVTPPFGWTGERTPVEIHSLAPAPAGFATFAATPRAYLSPRTSGGVATELRALSFLDEARLTGTIPADLPVDHYDLVIVNPDGGIGLLEDAYQVLAEAPPVVDALAPGSVPAQNDVHVTVLGSGFDPDAVAAATCRWTTLDPLDPSIVIEHFASLDAEPAPWVDAATLETVWDLAAAGVPIGAVCVLRVTNVGDGTYADFSALSVTPASRTPNDFDLSHRMNVARRAASGAALRMNTLDRYVFAIGGDNGLGGAELVTHASVEGSRIDPYGVMEGWTLQRNALPAGRSFTAAATVGRFVYLPGGHEGDGQTPSVLRAYLLDPEEATEVTDLDLTLVDGPGMEAGVWIYRISAVLDASDPNNPGGETLASEPVTVRVPALDESVGKKVNLTLFWDAIPHAVRYRVYRTPAAGGATGEERLLAEVDAGLFTPDRFTDDGTGTVDPAVSPMPLGSLGTWHAVGTLTTAREGAAVVAVPDPNVPGKTYLYAIGGLAAGATLRSYERATIVASATNAQSVTAFVETADALPDARWLAGAVRVDHVQVPAIPEAAAWIYVLPGSTAGGGQVPHVTAFPVDTDDGGATEANDGRLGLAVEVDSPAMSGGYGYTARNGWLYILGGSGSPDSAGKSAEICAAAGSGCGGGPPELVMWNAGIQMMEPRYLHATAVESGFVFILGGETATGASDTTESTNI